MIKNIFITGVSSGIGNGLAKHFLSQGCNVYAMNRNRPEGLDGNTEFHFASADFLDLDSIEAGVKELMSNVGQIDLVILNAGVLNSFKDMVDTSIDEIDAVMKINVWANKILLDSLFALDISVEQVVGISSGASISGNRGWNAYSLSKAALNMLIKLYAGERKDTHFCALSPGLIDTPMQDYLCELPEDARYETIERLKSARGTEIMLSPKEAAAGLVIAMERVLEFSSGEYVDVRKMSS